MWVPLQHLSGSCCLLALIFLGALCVSCDAQTDHGSPSDIAADPDTATNAELNGTLSLGPPPTVPGEALPTPTPDAMDAPDAQDLNDLDPADQRDIPSDEQEDQEIIRETKGLHFNDVTMAAGIADRHFFPPTKISDLHCGTPDTFISGAAVVDVDQDGWQDIYVARMQLPNRLWMNQGDGTFVDEATLRGVDINGTTAGVAFGDVDGDADLDLLLTFISDDQPRLFLNDGAGAFTEAMNRIPRFDSPEPCFVQSSASFGDADNDGDMDLLVGQWRRPNDPANDWGTRFYVNHSNGFFEDKGAEHGLDFTNGFELTPQFADVNDDGLMDLLFASDFGTSSLWVANNSLDYMDKTVEWGVGLDENGMGSATGDIDNDGDLDWFVTSIYDEECNFGWGCTGNFLYENQGGNNGFDDVTDVYGVSNGWWGWGIGLFDGDLDGDLDMAVANGYGFDWDVQPAVVNDYYADFVTDPFVFFINNGPGRPMWNAADVLGVEDTGMSRTVIPFDYDNDGDLDLFVTRNVLAPLLYRNEVPPGSWLRVQLSGHTNRFGIGAQVWVTRIPGDNPIRRDVTLNSTYLGHGPPEAHFGLDGHSGTLHEVKVIWQDTGETQILNDVSINQVLTVTQPPL